MPADQKVAPPSPIGLLDPDGRVWPFNQRFSPQMAAAGCKPIHSKKEYVELMKAQLKADAEETARIESEMRGVDPDTFLTDEGLPPRPPVSAPDARSALGIGERRNPILESLNSAPASEVE